jgi:type I restriction enzyme S subunit
MSEVINIPDGWVETTLEKVLESANTGLDAIKRAPIVEEETGIKCFRIQDASQKKEFNRWGNTLVENKNYERFKLIKGDILIARTGNTIGVNYLVKQNLKSVFNNGLIRLRANNRIDYKFLYKIIESNSFDRFIQSIAYGTSTQPNMQINVLLSYSLILPPLEEQKSIAAILTSFDDKIELLQAQNKTLEETAQTIFAEWFGKYQIDDVLPEGWRVGKLGEVTKTYGGTTPSTTNPDFWDGDIYWTSPKDLSNSKGIFLLNTDKKITKEGLKKISSGLLPKRTLLLSSRAPIGYLALTNIELAINQGYIAIVPEQYFSNNFMYLWLTENIKLVENASNGSTFMEISKSSFRNIDCVIPNKVILEKFDNFINPTFEKVLSNLIQIQTLTKTRDELLPRLMSGEVRVNEFKV